MRKRPSRQGMMKRILIILSTRNQTDESSPRFSSLNSSLAQASRSEFDFIKRIRRRALKRQRSSKAFHSSLITHYSSLRKGIGDDAAIIRQAAGRETVITTDLLVEEIDFLREAMPPNILGQKALAVSLSDIAAMGARPMYALTSIGLPRDVWQSSFVDDFYEGFFALADEFGVTLIGGDVSRTPEHIIVDSIVIGECARGRAILRGGARAGDHIFVTGALGGAAAGLRLMLRGARLGALIENKREARLTEKLLLRHLAPLPRVGWGVALGEERLATAMIDISDGLSSDLKHLCEESEVGALIEAARIPVDSNVSRLCGRRALDPLLLALHGGEDFELLFTVDPHDLARLPSRIDGVPVTYIGDVTDRPGRVRILEGAHAWDLEAGGFEHFGGGE
ncbi:MAG: thiamine-phosphate kinase [Pyrinomonadaceae bacterium]